MKFNDALGLSLRIFKNRPLRTFLTILGVGVGIGTVLFLVSLGYGLQRVILNNITNTDSLLSLDVNPGTSNLIELSQENIDQISQMSQVSEVSRMTAISSQLAIANRTVNGMVYAIDQSFFRLNGMNTTLGRLFESDDVYEVVISTAGIKLFDITNEDIINKELDLILYLSTIDNAGIEEIKTIKRDQKYKIVGVVDDENTPFVFLPLKSISDLPITRFEQLKVRVTSQEMMDVAREEIINRGFIVSSLSDTIEQANKIFGVIQIILFSFGAVALLVSAIGMFNTMTISLMEKTNEVGIMRSIGISGRDIKKVFLMESAIMGFLGGLGGVGIGYLSGFVVNVGFNLLAKNLGGTAVTLFYTPWQFTFVVVIFSTIVGFLTGIYPSSRASKLNPLDALRYK